MPAVSTSGSGRLCCIYVIMKGTTIFSDFLTALGVKHTGEYSDAQFRNMPFKSLFGFSRLLEAYGIDSRGVQLSDKKELTEIPTPYVAQLGSSFVVVNKYNQSSGTQPATFEYTLFHKKTSLPADRFIDKASGIVLMAQPSATSEEPQYTKHHFYEIADKVKLWLILSCTAFLIVTSFILDGFYSNVSRYFLLAVNILGILVTWQLVLKSLNVHTHSADKVCGILQKHGCDHVLEQKASKFFGLFGWSEVGITYFSVSTAILLIFPDSINYLALINACCLPFTVWSIWYQHFRLKTWCTLCVITQCLLWCQFFCYLFGNCWHNIFPFRLDLFLMGAAYVAVLMAINKVDNFIANRSNKKA